MRKLAILIAMLAVVGCSEEIVIDTPTNPPGVFEPQMFSGTWSGNMRASNGITLTGVVLTISFQEGAAAIGEWRATGLIGTPGTAAIFNIYRGRMTFTIQPDNITLVGRWSVNVVDPDTDLVLCEDSAEFRGSLITTTSMVTASDGFTFCNTLPGVAPQGVVTDWTKETLR